MRGRTIGPHLPAAAVGFERDTALRRGLESLECGDLSPLWFLGSSVEIRVSFGAKRPKKSGDKSPHSKDSHARRVTRRCFGC